VGSEEWEDLISGKWEVWSGKWEALVSGKWEVWSGKTLLVGSGKGKVKSREIDHKGQKVNKLATAHWILN
jgi:hypothetical protein